MSTLLKNSKYYKNFIVPLIKDREENEANFTNNQRNENNVSFLNLFKEPGTMTQDSQMIFLSPLQTPPLSDNNDSMLLEYSSESLLQNSLMGNFALVREILLNGDFNYNVSKQSKLTKFIEQGSHYNTIAGESDYLPKFKIDLEIVDDVRFFLNFMEKVREMQNVSKVFNGSILIFF